MVGFAHVALHVTLCSAAANLPPSATIPMHLHLEDSTQRQKFDQDFAVPRGDAMTHTVYFDAPRGTFRAIMLTANHACGFIDFWSFISESPRTIDETLASSPSPQQPIVLLQGSAPAAYLNAEPQFALLPKNTACAAPISDPPPANFRTENDGTSFYVWMSLDALQNSVLALQVETPTGEYHYIRMRPPLHGGWGGFPSTIDFNVTEDAIDWLAGQPVDQLLCPHGYWSSVSN